jgi:hypothetical protein
MWHEDAVWENVVIDVDDRIDEDKGVDDEDTEEDEEEGFERKLATSRQW